MDRLLHNPLLKDISYERMIDETINFLEILKIPVFFGDKLFEGKLKDYRLELPCDMIYVKQVLLNGVPARHATDTFHEHYHCLQDSMIYAMREPYSFTCSDFTITMQNGYLHASLKNADVQIAYKAILTDENGYPMIPDHRAFTNALEKYIEHRHLRLLWQNGKVKDNVYTESQQEYSFAAGQCETAMRSLELSAADALFNSWKTLLTYDAHFGDRFKYLGRRMK